jgi:ribosomal protein S18 acetylase RimI-like enzyme
MNAPHASRFYRGELSLAEIEGEYLPVIAGEVPIHPYVVHREGRAFGYVEWARFGDFADMQQAYGVTDPNCANCDILIGEPDLAYRGIGPRMIREFLERIVFAAPRVTSCVIDPRPENFIAIRAYEKVGFRFVRAVPDDLEGSSLYLMELRHDELDAPRAPAPYIRPGRLEELELASAIDDDACRAYADVGLAFTLPADHPFYLDEAARWADAARRWLLLFACAPDGEAVGLLVLGHADGRPYLKQLSVRAAWKRRGIGTMLLDRAKHWSVREGELWLTTYDAHVPWNEPWYGREGFIRVPDAACGPELAAILDEERRALPDAASRIAMVHRHR